MVFHPQIPEPSPYCPISLLPCALPHDHGPSLLLNRFYLGIYVVINIGIAIFALSRELYARLRSWSAGRTLFREMLSAVLYAPMSFFDTTPLGRIVNRFSKVSIGVLEMLLLYLWR
jgi:ABC-type multidrug transport system fused ATPase/permease subunit